MNVKAICIGMLALAVAAMAAPLAATVSRGAIGVGETAIIRLSGGQVRQIMPTPAELEAGIAGALTFRRLDGSRWEVTGAKPCNCQVEFGDGKETVTVRIKVVKK